MLLGVASIGVARAPVIEYCNGILLITKRDVISICTSSFGKTTYKPASEEKRELNARVKRLVGGAKYRNDKFFENKNGKRRERSTRSWLLRVHRQRIRSGRREKKGRRLRIVEAARCRCTPRVSELSVWKNTAACVSHLLEAECARAQVHDPPAHRPELARRRAFVVGIGHPRRELSLRDGPRISSSRRAASRRAASRRVHANANRAFSSVIEDKFRRRERRRRSSSLFSSSSSLSSSSSSSSSSFLVWKFKFRAFSISMKRARRQLASQRAETHSIFDDPFDSFRSDIPDIFSPRLSVLSSSSR